MLAPFFHLPQCQVLIPTLTPAAILKDFIMPYKTLSEYVKSKKQSKLKENILQAVKAYRAEQAKSK